MSTPYACHNKTQPTKKNDSPSGKQQEVPLPWQLFNTRWSSEKGLCALPPQREGGVKPLASILAYSAWWCRNLVVSCMGLRDLQDLPGPWWSNGLIENPEVTVKVGDTMMVW